jgi:hypothetical protein
MTGEAEMTPEEIEANRTAMAGLELTRALREDDWEGASAVWEQILTRADRQALLGYAIRIAAADDAIVLMDAALADLAAMPAPALGRVGWDARQWAEWASPHVRKHVLLACFLALSAKDRADFLAAAQRRVLQGATR